MAFELWQTAPSSDGGILKISSLPVKLSGFDGIIARRLQQTDPDIGQEIPLDAPAVAGMLPGVQLDAPLLVWSSKSEDGCLQFSEVMRLLVKCGSSNCDVILHMRGLHRSGESYVASMRESAEAMLLTGGVGRGLHSWKWAAPKMAIGGTIVSGW